MIKKAYRLLAVLTAVIIAVSLAKGMNLAQISAKFPDGEVAEITKITEQDWTEAENGTGVFYTIPESISNAQVLEITCNWASVDVYLENELLYSFKDEYQELGRALHWIEIPEQSNAKRIILTSDSDSALKNTLQCDNYLGTADAIRHHFFMKNLPTLLFAIVDILMAAVVILILTSLRHRLSDGLLQGARDLLFFIMLNGIWLISDGGFPQCFTENTGLWALISYVAFMLMPAFMVRFAQSLLTRRRKCLYVLSMTSLGLTSITLILYVTRLAPLSMLLVLHQVLTVLDYAVVFILCNYELKHYRIKRLRAVRDGVIIMGILITLGMIVYWNGMNTLYPLLFGAGFTFYIICLTISVVQQTYSYLEKRSEMDNYRKLAYKDMMTALYNRTAFMEYQKKAGACVRQSAYILFDVNGLKSVNDTRGHQAGDDLIMRAATCIREAFDGIGNCYRIGGDEFMVVLGNVRNKTEVRKLLEHFKKQVWLSNMKLAKSTPPLSIAYGYSLAGNEARTSEEMYDEADKWMYCRKRSLKAKEIG